MSAERYPDVTVSLRRRADNPVAVTPDDALRHALGGYREYRVPADLRQIAEVAWCYSRTEGEGPIPGRGHRVLPETGVSICFWSCRDGRGAVSVFNGLSGWQIYAGPRYIQPVTIVPDRWVHFRVVVHGARLELSVDGKTVVFPQMLGPAAAGAVALTATGSPAHFANFVMTRGETPTPEGGDGAPAVATPAGILARWRVSTAFAEKRLDSLGDLDPAGWRDLTWDPLEPGPGGIANLAMLRKLDGERKTVFAATTLHADEAKRVLLRFGFSDCVRVYLNGRPLYRGNAAFQTRDYHFLGTVGLFDELVLPLKRGDNELWFAVSESYGGWAVVAQLP